MSVLSPLGGATLSPHSPPPPGHFPNCALCAANHGGVEKTVESRGGWGIGGSDGGLEQGEEGERARALTVHVGVSGFKGRSLFSSATLLSRKAPAGTLQTSIPSHRLAKCSRLPPMILTNMCRTSRRCTMNAPSVSVHV